jgi:NAD(P)H-hydrate epimerase
VSDGILLSPAAMAAVDRAAIAAGLPGPWLMENAGRAVTRAITARFPPQPTLILCGPGNNGGDGFVLARRLAAAGWPVRVAALVECQRLKGDAAWAASGWAGPVEPVTAEALDGADLVVDALFGAGLDRPLTGAALAIVERLLARGGPVVAVDVPSGVHGGTGAILGAAPRACCTVTFCRLKPGHLLLPGRLHMGEVVLAGIGIPDEIVQAQDEQLRVNAPPLWRAHLRHRTPAAHKYSFGHAVVVGGPVAMTGAARLAAGAALRAGAGLVSIACEPEALPAYAAQLTTVMVKQVVGSGGLAQLLGDQRFNAVLIGPGAGVGEGTRAKVLAVLAQPRAVVLDADAITSFAETRGELLGSLHRNCVLTPHEGEFRRLFPGEGDRLSRARQAAAEAGTVVLLKGSDTIVAAPDGRACIMPEAPAELATAGTGDVLAGIILGLLAQGMPTYEGAAAGAWLHAQAARGAGAGLIAEDLAERLPAVLAAPRAPE